MENNKEIKDLICPVCCKYGGFNGKKCTRCGVKKKRNKFICEGNES